MNNRVDVLKGPAPDGPETTAMTGAERLGFTAKAETQVAAIHRRIKEAFRRNAELEADRVTITMANGRVELGGRLHSWREREAAEHAARSVAGVADVRDRIVLD
jgi:osmotically-inducible protein OsmY